MNKSKKILLTLIFILLICFPVISLCAGEDKTTELGGPGDVYKNIKRHLYEEISTEDFENPDKWNYKLGNLGDSTLKRHDLFCLQHSQTLGRVKDNYSNGTCYDAIDKYCVNEDGSLDIYRGNGGKPGTTAEHFNADTDVAMFAKALTYLFSFKKTDIGGYNYTTNDNHADIVADQSVWLFLNEFKSNSKWSSVCSNFFGSDAPYYMDNIGGVPVNGYFKSSTTGDHLVKDESKTRKDTAISIATKLFTANSHRLIRCFLYFERYRKQFYW